jgi:hypothetical protein
VINSKKVLVCCRKVFFLLAADYVAMAYIWFSPMVVVQLKVAILTLYKSSNASGILRSPVEVFVNWHMLEHLTQLLRWQNHIIHACTLTQLHNGLDKKIVEPARWLDSKLLRLNSFSLLNKNDMILNDFCLWHNIQDYQLIKAVTMNFFCALCMAL